MASENSSIARPSRIPFTRISLTRISLTRISLTCVALLALGAARAERAAAQDTTGAPRPEAPPRPLNSLNAFERRSSGSVAFVQVRPVGSLASNIGFGYGGMGTYVFRLDRAGYFGLRTDVGLAVYGQESERVPLSSTIGGRIEVKLSTDNYVVPFTIGPQLMLPRGPIRPYANVGFGGQAFYTQSRVEGTDDSDAFATTTNQSDVTRTWVAGAGVLIPIHEGRPSVRVDLGAQYFTGGHAKYLRPGSIQDLPNSQISITTLASDTHMYVVRIGVNVGI